MVYVSQTGFPIASLFCPQSLLHIYQKYRQFKRTGGQPGDLFFFQEKKTAESAGPTDVYRSPLCLIFGLRGLRYVFFGRVEIGSEPINPSR